MHEWSSKTLEFLLWALRYPGTTEEAVGLGVAALGIMLLTYRWVGAGLGVRDTGRLARVSGVVLGLLLMMAGAVAVSLYVAPRVGQPLDRIGTVAAPVLVALVLAVPAQMLLTRSRYPEVLVSFAASLLVGFLAVTALSAVVDAVAEGRRQSSVMKREKQAADEVMDGEGPGAGTK